jgi:HEPN domain-containing protein
MAIDYLRRARSRLIDAGSALDRGDYPEVVRYSQESVELSLKAALRIVGIEYPKVHDVGDILVINKDKYPEWFIVELDKIRVISAELAMKRAPAMYGVEEMGKTPSDLFDKEDARDSLEKASYIISIVDRLINEFLSTK